MSSKIKLLCAGSCGFNISNLVRYLLKNSTDYEIFSIDDIKPPTKLNTIYANRAHQFQMGDITNSHLINNICEIERPDIIINGAEQSTVSNQELVKSNILGTQVLIDAAVKYKSRFIYLSTYQVYGSLSTENEPSWTEESPLNPQNSYSSTKASGELLVKSAHFSQGLQYNITRSCNNYGPRQSRQNLIPKIIGNVLDGIEVPIYNAGENVRSWCHVQDNCEAIKTIIEKGVINNTYNIGTNQEFSTIEVFNEVCNILGKGHELLKFEPNETVKNNFRSSSNISKLKSFGWESKFNFKKGGLESVIKWYNSNAWFLK